MRIVWREVIWGVGDYILSIHTHRKSKLLLLVGRLQQSKQSKGILGSPNEYYVKCLYTLA